MGLFDKAAHAFAGSFQLEAAVSTWRLHGSNRCKQTAALMKSDQRTEIYVSQTIAIGKTKGRRGDSSPPASSDLLC